jgi:hypothetical protein
MRFPKPLRLLAALLVSVVAVNSLHGQISGSGVSSVPGVRKFASSAIPFIISPTGSMANNGAITLGTALPVTYPNAYLFLPASAVSAGSSAGWYFTQFSSATVGTVFNNTYVSGQPNIPSSPIAFATTGPGAYTGVITSQVGPNYSVPGGSMGANGTLRIWSQWGCPGNVNNKIMIIQYGTQNVLGHTEATATTLAYVAANELTNSGVANAQVVQSAGLLGAATGAQKLFAINTGATQTLQAILQTSVATDYLILDSMTVEVIPG